MKKLSEMSRHARLMAKIDRGEFDDEDEGSVPDHEDPVPDNKE